MTSITEFLSAFFPDPAEPIYFRAFKAKKAEATPSNAPVKDEGCRDELLQPGGLRERLVGYNKERGLYFVVNSGGHTAADIARYTAWFCESDTASISAQHDALDISPLLPAIRVETKNSVHAYWLIEGFCGDSDWKDIQLRLIQHFGGDDKIKDPSRVMRLPHFSHISLAEDGSLVRKKVEIAFFNPDLRYTLAEMKDAFAPVELAKVRHVEYSGYSAGDYPTWEALHGEARSRIVSHPTAKLDGKWIRCRGICHDGNGDTAIGLHIAGGAYSCKMKCSAETIRLAFGLPGKPTPTYPHKQARGEATVPLRHQPSFSTGESSSEDEAPVLESPAGNTLLVASGTCSTTQPAGIFSVEDLSAKIDDLYDHGRPPGENPGWSNLNEIYTVKKKQWTIVTGTPGSGKTAFVDAMLVNLAKFSGWKFAVCSLENQPLEQHASTLLELYTGQPFSDGPTPRMSPATMMKAKTWLHEHFTFMLPPEDERNISGALSLIRWAKDNKQIDAAVLDPWNEFEHKRSPGVSLTEHTGQALTQVRSCARAEDIHIWVVAHPTKLYRNKAGEFPVPTLYDISDSSHFNNKSDMGLVITRDTTSDTNPTVVHVVKVRYRWCGKVDKVELYFDKVTGQYHESPYRPKVIIDEDGGMRI